MSSRSIHVDYLARVEGEGGIHVTFTGDQVTDVQLSIFEPPRFFEAFLRGRAFSEAPDITARICGICPVAYQMSSVHAMEQALGISVTGPLRALRRLLYCGEWIESHALHVFMLHAPDFVGYPDAIAMAKDHPEIVERALKAKKAGNAIVARLGGREIHPINVRVGGFYKVPTRRDLATLQEDLLRGRELALDAVRWTANLPIPQFEQDYEFVALHHDDEYAMNEGHVVSNWGLNILPTEYEDHFAEEHVPYSTALHSTHRGHGAYLVGPLARYALNHAQLSPLAKEAARDAGLGPVSRNPFQSIVVRSVEMLYAFDEALRIIADYVEPEQPHVAAEPRAGVGCACTEAPRGMLYHRYRLDEAGTIVDAKIVPPTSQNQKIIEDDLRRVAAQSANSSDEELTLRCEQTVRNYDPCISCSTHFLKLTVERT